MIDYETNFPGDFPAALRDFATRINGGKSYGARKAAAAELRMTESTLRNCMEGRPSAQEPMARRLMTLVLASAENEKTRQP